MLGAILGDIAGSIYEWNNIKTKDFQPLLADHAFFTDDTVLTIAVADALLHQREPAAAFKDWGRRYPDMSWGGRFARWLFSAETAPYGSFGNGAAMRVSPVGLLGQDAEEVLRLSAQVTAVTHDHREGLKGAAATATAIFLARQGTEAAALRSLLSAQFGYDLSATVDTIRPDYRFDETCQGTVPQALICALEATDFEDAIRNAISIGGDSDTLAAIAGGIAEARFGIPASLAQAAWVRLPNDMRGVLTELYQAAQCPLPGSLENAS